MAHYNDQGEWVADMGDDPNNPTDAPLKANNWYQGETSMAQAQGDSQLTSPEGYKGGFWQYLSDMTDKGLVGNESQGLGGVAGFLRSHGYVVPLAFAAAAGGAAAMGAGGAYGSMGGAAGMGSSMGTGLTTGAGATGLTTGAGASGGLLGAGSASGIAATEAAAGLGGEYLTSSGMSLSDMASYANKARQGYGALNSISKLLGGVGGLAGGQGGGQSGQSGFNPQQIAAILKPKVTTNDFIGQYKMNQNPFLFNVPGQTVASPNEYDVSGSNIANALRKA